LKRDSTGSPPARSDPTSFSVFSVPSC
jgi:hypothetical protein